MGRKHRDDDGSPLGEVFLGFVFLALAIWMPFAIADTYSSMGGDWLASSDEPGRWSWLPLWATVALYSALFLVFVVGLAACVVLLILRARWGEGGRP